MGIFSKVREAVTPAPSDEDVRRAQRDHVHDVLERSAKLVEDEALAKADAIFAEATEEHNRQVAGYRFKCSVEGRFLLLSAVREGNPTEKKEWFFYDEVPIHDYSTALNLSGIGAIRLDSGHAPDRQGILNYAAALENDDPAVIGGTCGGMGWGNFLPPQGQHWVARARYPNVPYSRPLFIMVAPQCQDDRNVIDLSASDYRIKHTTPNYVRPAEDDRVVFEGLHATLYVPAGLGAGVYAEILRATG